MRNQKIASYSELLRSRIEDNQGDNHIVEAISALSKPYEKRFFISLSSGHFAKS